MTAKILATARTMFSIIGLACLFAAGLTLVSGTRPPEFFSNPPAQREASLEETSGQSLARGACGAVQDRLLRQLNGVARALAYFVGIIGVVSIAAAAYVHRALRGQAATRGQPTEASP